MLTIAQFRALALALPGTTEGAHMDHPDFRTNGRIFATLHPDGLRGMVKLTPEQQCVRCKAVATFFTPASGAWGRQGCTIVDLAAADRTMVTAALTDAWQNAQAMAKPKSSRAKKRS